MQVWSVFGQAPHHIRPFVAETGTRRQKSL
jgi:hypothetical protein